jgi:tetrapyrrole methylase family protein / MazG family protein
VSERADFFAKLVELMAILRGPAGCPWDREQDRETLKPMLVEEAWEVLEALDGEDPDALCEELGDLLFQVVFHCQIAQERGEFDAQEVCRRVYEKMVARHPHVFGDREIRDSRELLRNWEEIKATQQAATGRTKHRNSLLDGIPEGLPAIYQAYQATSKAARVGFDWPDLEGLREKLLEEFDELQEARREGDPRKVKEEVGDLMFAALNVARYLEIDPETAVSSANRKFVTRFQAMEREFDRLGRPLNEVRLDEMERVWQSLKNRDRDNAPE